MSSINTSLWKESRHYCPSGASAILTALHHLPRDHLAILMKSAVSLLDETDRTHIESRGRGSKPLTDERHLDSPFV